MGYRGSRVYGICAIIFKGYRGLWFRDNVVRSKSEEGWGCMGLKKLGVISISGYAL